MFQVLISSCVRRKGCNIIRQDAITEWVDANERYLCYFTGTQRFVFVNFINMKMAVR